MDRRGFTLVEVLVALAIMAILIGTAAVNLGAGLRSTHVRDATRAVQQFVRHAKSVALLKQRGYRLTSATAADLFPKCAHVESICCLIRE